MDIINYERHDAQKGFVDHGPRGNDYYYQIVPAEIKKEPEFLPALTRVFAPMVPEIIDPETGCPYWTCILKNVTVNPWIQGDLVKVYPSKIGEIIDLYF